MFNASSTPGSTSVRTLDNSGPRAFMKIYCPCGKIVDLGKREMGVKLSLKKELECTACRNARISRDIDFLNDLFDPDRTVEEYPLY
ncbi:MAG: hypothetical protein FWH47_03265 [Methanomassiliicoccaceae archaeon]|nr:hypothetical protein [Methanomassiliicoccaceae archaeon]